MEKQMHNPINSNHLVEVGYVKKTHGVQGELYLVLEPDVADMLEEYEFLFFLIDGLPVPFKVEETPTIGDDFAHVRFRYINTKEQAQSFVGSKLLAVQAGTEENTISPDSLIGYQLNDTQLGPIGAITAIDDYGGNIVLTVWHNKQEVLIPFNEELLVDFQSETRTMTMNCPDGIFD
jgi:16S rRNA processing protein RimM